MHTVLVVLGNQVPEGQIRHPYRAYCDIAIDYARTHEDVTAIVTTGGFTTKDALVSEAEVGARYIERTWQKVAGGSVSCPTLLREEESRTTPENVRYTLELLSGSGQAFQKVVVIGRRSQTLRVLAMLWRKRAAVRSALGSKPTIETIAGPNTDTKIRKMIDWLLIALDFLSPDGENQFYRWLKVRERNG